MKEIQYPFQKLGPVPKGESPKSQTGKAAEGQPHSKTLVRCIRRLIIPSGFGLRLSFCRFVLGISMDHLLKPAFARCGSIAFVLVVLLLLNGCRAFQSTAQLPGRAVGTVTGKGKKAVDPVELQQQLMRFGDDFAGRMVLSTEQLRRGTNVLPAIELQTWKVRYSGNVLAIASGPNTLANLLDLIVLVTLTRNAIQDYWMPKVYGDSAQAMLDACRDAETRIWSIAAPVLKPKEQDELKSMVQAWYQKNPDPNQVLMVRSVGFASQLAAEGNRSQEPASVFHLLGMDVFSGLDPAAREIAQTRLFAERALFVSQRMPTLLRWQMELFSYELTATPEVKQAMDNAERLTRTVETFGRTADQLPKLIDEQREAAIKQVFDGLAVERTNLLANLAAEENNLKGTLVELRQTLNAGTDLTKSSDQLVRSLDTFMGRFDKGTNAPSPEPATNARPFDISDYATTAKEVTMTIKELNTTINSLDNAIPKLQRTGDTFEAAGNRLLTRFFVIGAILVVLLFVCAFLAALAYRRFSGRSILSDSIPRHREPEIRV